MAHSASGECMHEYTSSMDMFSYISTHLFTVAARLIVNDLQVVKSDLWEARTKWKDFGLALSMKQSTLDAIAITQRDDPGNCLREMLAEWLRGAGEPPRTWTTIVNAMATVDGLGSLAEEVGKKYNVEFSATTGANSAQGGSLVISIL